MLLRAHKLATECDTLPPTCDPPFLCRSNQRAWLIREHWFNMIRSTQPLPRCPHGDMPWGACLEMHMWGHAIMLEK